MQHVFIVGSKGIPSSYGGYETFVEKLTENRISDEIKYHVACAVDQTPKVWDFEYNGAHCFNIMRRPIGAAKAIFYDIDALRWCIKYINANDIKHPIVYILACRIGPFVKKYIQAIHSLGGAVFVNPDGHEWKRAKWNALVRRYWKISEWGMVNNADLLVCDSKNIESYIKHEYSSLYPKTTYIAYGADTRRSTLADEASSYTNWLSEKDLAPFEYYLVVGRFVPENNYETMIREFIASNSNKNFALITGVDDKFLAELEKKTGYTADPRIKFVGTVYDQELLKKIRENAFAYFHGHEVGGTNPSLLEALSSTKLNLLLDVGFNREVAGDSALYWTKEENSLRELIEYTESLSHDAIVEFDSKSTQEIVDRYSWCFITEQYESLFLQQFKERE